MSNVCTVCRKYASAIDWKSALDAHMVKAENKIARIRELEAEIEDAKATAHERGYYQGKAAGDAFGAAMREHVTRLEAENKALREWRGVKPLPRSDGDGGWTLTMDLLSDLGREVQAQGWDGCTAEVTEIIALSVERRILSALSPAPLDVGVLA